MKIKALIGVLLITLSVSGLFLWETKYRDKLTLLPVVAAAKEIHAGDVVDESFFKIINVYPNNALTNGLKGNNISELYGMVCIADTYESEQILLDRFAYKETLDPVETRILVIPNTWIYMFSNQFVPGDFAEIYFMPDREYAGRYKVSLVTEETIEIVCKLDEYYALYDRVMCIDNEGNSQRLMCLRME